jgi:hypothetical protein
MENAVATQVGRVWSDGVLVEAAKITRMTRMAGAVATAFSISLSFTAESAAAFAEASLTLRILRSIMQSRMVPVKWKNADAEKLVDDGNSLAS